jgi:hypothetical protein
MYTTLKIKKSVSTETEIRFFDNGITSIELYTSACEQFIQEVKGEPKAEEVLLTREMSKAVSSSSKPVSLNTNRTEV